MLEAITRHLRLNRRAMSNVIVIMLSLVLIVIIVSNIVLWSYQMNQLDLERMQEKVMASNATRIMNSSWFTAGNEYTVNTGSHLNGAYSDTQTADGIFETFREEPVTTDLYRLNLSNDFIIDPKFYPLDYVHAIEITVRYNVTQDTEKWFLKAYNWTSLNFSDLGFNSTTGSQPSLNEWNEYTINITNDLTHYVNSNGILHMEFFDEGLNTTQTTAGIDFFATRTIVDGIQFDMTNQSPFTTHIIAVWIINSTNHQRYDANFFMNSGEETAYIRIDLDIPQDNFIIKIVTEKGNITVFP